MLIYNESLDWLEKQADKMEDSYLLMLIQILREIRILRALLEKNINYTDNSCNSTDDSAS